MSDYPWMAAVLAASLLLTGFGAWKVLSSRGEVGHPWSWMLALFVLQTVALAWRGMLLGECPVRGFAEVVFFMGWALNAFYLLLGRMYRMSVLGLFTAPAVAACTAIALWTYDAPHAFPLMGGWLTWHIGLAMLAYGAFGLAAVAGIVFLIQDGLLKEHRVAGASGKLPPIRTLQTVMGRLVGAGFFLLLVSLLFGWLTGIPIASGKAVIAVGISAAYLVLLLWRHWKGMPGRTLAWICLVLYVCSLAIFFVLK